MYTPKSKMFALLDCRLVFGHSLLTMHSGGRLFLSGSVWATVVVNRSMPTSYSQDLRWRFMFVYSLRLSVEKAVYYLGLLSVIHIDTNIYILTQPPLFIPRGSTQDAPTWSWEHGVDILRSTTTTAPWHRAAKQSSPRMHREWRMTKHQTLNANRPRQPFLI